MARTSIALYGLLVVSLIVGCTGYVVRAPIGHEETRQHAVRRPGTYVVQRGDTLYSISWRFGIDYRALAAWNGITAPYVIFPGQQIAVTEVAAPRARTARPRPRATAGAAERGVNQSAARTSRTSPVASLGTAPRKSGGGAEHDSGTEPAWGWPVKGPIIRRYNQRGNRGLDIAGRLGTKIRASAPGRVVYSGSGLIGYGKLIIIKHNDQFLTAYAHNDKILVSEGETVAKGVPIAEMGSSGTNRVKLHFEIRKDGNPVDPAKYLPKL